MRQGGARRKKTPHPSGRGENGHSYAEQKSCGYSFVLRLYGRGLSVRSKR